VDRGIAVGQQPDPGDYRQTTIEAAKSGRASGMGAPSSIAN